jgi:hypothetical protein
MKDSIAIDVFLEPKNERIIDTINYVADSQMWVSELFDTYLWKTYNLSKTYLIDFKDDDIIELLFENVKANTKGWKHKKEDYNLIQQRHIFFQKVGAYEVKVTYDLGTLKKYGIKAARVRFEFTVIDEITATDYNFKEIILKLIERYKPNSLYIFPFYNIEKLNTYKIGKYRPCWKVYLSDAPMVNFKNDHFKIEILDKGVLISIKSDDFDISSEYNKQEAFKLYEYLDDRGINWIDYYLPYCDKFVEENIKLGRDIKSHMRRIADEGR